MNEDRKLAGKVALVFGGSRGIGAAAARRLAREGADVALTYVSAPDKAADIVHAIEAEGCSGLAIRADSADPAAIRSATAEAVERLGRLDIVVVNAGRLRLGDVQAVSLQDLDLMLEINVRVFSWPSRRPRHTCPTVAASSPSAATRRFGAAIQDPASIR